MTFLNNFEEVVSICCPQDEVKSKKSLCIFAHRLPTSFVINQKTTIMGKLERQYAARLYFIHFLVILIEGGDHLFGRIISTLSFNFFLVGN